ncbi:MAG: hypothetical protein IJP66_05265 [Kiritimatiellae bacterium]|nr:hypothetical protein [Kiritimatiellia bacterium]
MKRHDLNPILAAGDVPYPATLVFNAGVCKWRGKYVMLFRNDFGSTEAQWREAAAKNLPWPGFSTMIGVATTDDFERFEILSLSAPDNRNMVLFPEKIGGRYARLERPMPVYSRYGGPERFDIWLSESSDLRFWGETRLVLRGADVTWAGGKIGPAAPPVRTPRWTASSAARRCQ